MEFNPSALLEPRAYSHAVSSIRLHETHISWVFLTGAWVYKVKKPVNFGFLDYSTLEKRRHYCHEELRLNSRLAPQLYVGVVPVCGEPDHPQLEVQGEPFEYAVKMREFPQEGLLDRQLNEGRFSLTSLDQLAHHIARFHMQAAPVLAPVVWGDPEENQGPARDNFTTLLQLEPGLQEVLAPLAGWTESVYADLADVMAERKAQGFVRELHGDLHAGNIAEIDGQLVPFDGIEFNDAFRCIDTMNDLAFLVSDLEHRGRPDLGRRVLDIYLAETGDYAGLRLWNYYGVYRLMVRAKVTALRMGQQHPELAAEVACYLSQATRHLQAPAPRLVITHGLSASGKSTWSQHRLEQEDIIRLRSDVMRKRLAGLGPLESSHSAPGQGIYQPDQTRATYQALAQQAEMLLGAGHSVLIDATFLERPYRDLLREVARRQGASFQLVTFQVPPEILRQRIVARKQGPSEANLAVLERQLASSKPLDPDEEAICVGPEGTLF